MCTLRNNLPPNKPPKQSQGPYQRAPGSGNAHAEPARANLRLSAQPACHGGGGGGGSYQMEFLILCCSALASVPCSPGTRAGRAPPGAGVPGSCCGGGGGCWGSGCCSSAIIAGGGVRERERARAALETLGLHPSTRVSRLSRLPGGHHGGEAASGPAAATPEGGEPSQREGASRRCPALWGRCGLAAAAPRQHLVPKQPAQRCLPLALLLRCQAKAARARRLTAALCRQQQHGSDTGGAREGITRAGT